MLMRKNVTALVVGVIFVFAPLRVVTQSEERWLRQDGFWWQDRSSHGKILFLYGYVTAMRKIRVMLEAQQEFIKSAPERTSVELRVVADPAILAVFEKHNNALYRFTDFHSIAIGQYLAGLDQFYADYRNQSILFDYAIRFVRDQVRGTPQQELDKTLEEMRRTAGGASAPF